MTVFRDAYGVPHVRAGTVLELAFAQGHVTARDRAWQLDIERRRGDGTTAALVGPAGVHWDVFARRARIADVARRAYDGLDDETRAFVTSYVDGVNAAFAEGATAPELTDRATAPGAWEPWTPLTVFLVQHVLFGSFASKLWREHLRDTVGDAAVELFRTEGLSGGSNALAVGPGRTASGQPVVAGDPHRLFEAPNVYQQVRLACDEFDVAGFTFPGVPGVQHFAHAGEVAWAITNAIADYQDLYPERLERRGDEVWAFGPSGWARAERHDETIEVLGADPVPVEVVVTPRGPVILGGPDDPSATSLRTPSWLTGDLGFSALLPLLRSRSVADVDAAFATWVEPVNNVVIADRSGTVLHRVAGLVPTRDGDTWTGWVSDLPRTPVARDAHFATANQRGSAAYDVLSDDFAPPFRADRIDELLGDRRDLTAEQVVEVLADTRQNAGGVLLGLVADLEGLSPVAAKAQAELAAWDRQMTPGSPGAALFAGLRDRVVDRICAAEPLAPLDGGSPHGELYDPWFSVAVRVASSLHVILASDRPFGLVPAELVADALEDVATAEQLPAWGDRHRFHPLHALEQLGVEHPRTTPDTPLPGDSDAVFAAGFLPGTELCIRGPVARYVWDLADPERGGWAVPLGASGVPGSAHHADQHATWAAGGVVPLVTDWDLLEEER